MSNERDDDLISGSKLPDAPHVDPRLDPVDQHWTISQGRAVPPPFIWRKHSAEETELIRQRQRGRAKVMAWLLGALVILLFFVAMAKIKAGMGH